MHKTGQFHARSHIVHGSVQIAEFHRRGKLNYVLQRIVHVFYNRIHFIGV